MIWKMIRPGTEARIELVPYATFGKYDDVMRRVPDTTKATRILGFEAKWSLEDGLPPTIEWQISRRRQLAGKA
jgi:UDP-glucose 4-epimerase